MSLLFTNRSGEWWDFAMILSLASVAVAGVAVLIFTYGSVRVHKRETKAAEAALEKYKAETARNVVQAAMAASDAAKTAYSAGESAGLAQAGLVVAQARIKSAEKDIAEANKMAAQATQQAANLGLKVNELPKFVGQKEVELKALAASMNKSSGELDRAREAAQQAQARAESALNLLRRESQGRNLDKTQIAAITAGLRNVNLPAILVQSEPGDTESYPYAMQILAAIKNSGQRVSYQTWPSMFMWFNEPGVFVTSAPSVNRQRRILLGIMNAAGLDVKEVDNSDKPPSKEKLPQVISIVVWKRPLPKAL